MCRSHELVRESEKHYKEIIQVLEVSKLRYYNIMSNLLHSSSDCVCVFQHIGIYDCCVCVSLWYTVTVYMTVVCVYLWWSAERPAVPGTGVCGGREGEDS